MPRDVRYKVERFFDEIAKNLAKNIFHVEGAEGLAKLKKLR